MTTIDVILANRIEKLDRSSLLRKLHIPGPGVDFYSNDYLGLAQGDHVSIPDQKVGATGSRLLSGNSAESMFVEEWLANVLDVESALIFNSGYTANLGLLACIASRHDTILYDEFVHASIRDGIRLSTAQSFSFCHNSLEDLQQKALHARGCVFVVIESVYSMDGDTPDKQAILELCKTKGWNLIVDEAHAFGIMGIDGKGMFHESRNDVFARIVTFGKAVGFHGAAVLGSTTLKEYLVNFCRPFIYSTSLPPRDYVLIQHQVKRMFNAHSERVNLARHIETFQSMLSNQSSFEFLVSKSPIQGIVIPGNDRALKLASFLAEQGIEVRAIRSPTVPQGRERLRVILHSYNSDAEVHTLYTSLAKYAG